MGLTRPIGEICIVAVEARSYGHTLRTNTKGPFMVDTSLPKSGNLHEVALEGVLRAVCEQTLPSIIRVQVGAEAGQIEIEKGQVVSAGFRGLALTDDDELAEQRHLVAESRAQIGE